MNLGDTIFSLVVFVTSIHQRNVGATIILGITAMNCALYALSKEKTVSIFSVLSNTVSVSVGIAGSSTRKYIVEKSMNRRNALDVRVVFNTYH